MKHILVLGAGLSATCLINYLLDHSEKEDWKIRLGDIDESLAKSKINGHPRGESIKFDINDAQQVEKEIKACDIAVSMLPARFHPIIAKSCVKNGKSMSSASYVSKEMQALDSEAKAKGLTLLNELGVDPGIDHMSAMRVIDRIKNMGGKLLSFSSNTGGLVAPDYDNNPWNYKFTWNPRNVVLAGQATACFLKDNKYKYVPYNQLYTRVENTTVLDYGEFEVYPNRDSISYRKIYGIEDIPSIFRGTMRRPGYSEAWNVFVQLGMTDDSVKFVGSEDCTYRDFTNAFLKYDANHSVEKKLCDNLNLDPNGIIMKKLTWLGIFEDKKIGLKDASPAQVLQKLLESKWGLGPEDKDILVMQHKFEYELNGEKKGIQSSFAYIGKTQEETAMAITVGTPLAIATRMLATGKIKLKGVQIPVVPELYNPILDELLSLIHI